MRQFAFALQIQVVFPSARKILGVDVRPVIHPVLAKQRGKRGEPNEDGSMNGCSKLGAFRPGVIRNPPKGRRNHEIDSLWISTASFAETRS